MIADDSRKPLDLQGDSLTIVQLPFNSGLSYGLNQALERVDTPYVMRMNDDELLTVRTRLGKQVEFLERYSEIDIVGFCVLTAIRCQNPDEAVSEFSIFLYLFFALLLFLFRIFPMACCIYFCIYSFKS